jgi:hypothetical protein
VGWRCHNPFKVAVVSEQSAECDYSTVSNLAIDVGLPNLAGSLANILNASTERYRDNSVPCADYRTGTGRVHGDCPKRA